MAAMVLAVALSAGANSRDDWSNYVFAVRERSQAAGVSMSPATQGFVWDLGFTNLGTACQTNFSRGQTNVVCWTNWGIAETNLTATNFVVTYAGQTQPVERISAASIAAADVQTRALLAAGVFVDVAAITNAGGLASWRTSTAGTNWHFIGEGEPDVATNFQWHPVVMHPTNLPLLTLSNAWNRAGLPVLTNWTVSTNPEVASVEGWTVGVFTSQFVTITNPAPRTNLTRRFVFTWEPPRTNFAATFATAVFFDQRQPFPDTGTDLIWRVQYPETLPADIVPTGEQFTNQAPCRVIWSPPWTNAPTNVVGEALTVTVSGTVFAVRSNGWSTTHRTNELATVADSTRAQTIQLARAWSAIDLVDVPTGSLTVAFRGASLAVVFTAAEVRVVGDALSTHGNFVTNLIERRRLVEQLAWTRADVLATNWLGWASDTFPDAASTSAVFMTPPVPAATNAYLQRAEFRLGNSSFGAGRIHAYLESIPPASTLEHLESYAFHWPTSAPVSVTIPTTATNMAASAVLVGQMLPDLRFPWRQEGGILVDRWPLTNSDVVNVVTNTAGETYSYTSTVTWASDALGVWTNRLEIWPAVVVASNHAAAVTTSVFEVYSGLDPNDAANWQSNAVFSSWGTGSDDWKWLFIRPTRRDFVGEWLLQWEFPARW